MSLTLIYRWVPSLYFIQGLPAALINYVSPVLYKNLHLNNRQIALVTSLYAFPWLLKVLLAPALEIYNKKKIVIAMQFIIAALLLLLLFSLGTENFFYWSSLIFLSLALVSAVHDISADGIYIVALTRHEQARYLGIRSLFYQLGILFCHGGLIFLVGHLALSYNLLLSWQTMFGLLVCFMLCIAVYNQKTLPHLEQSNSRVNSSSLLKNFLPVFKEFRALPHFTMTILFTMVYNFSEAQLVKILPLFLLDKIEHGGLALNVKEVGMFYGGIGTACLLLGITVSGFLINTLTLKRSLLPLTLFAAVTNIGYIFLSMFHIQHLWLIGLLIGCAKFGFGLSSGAYMMWLLHTFAKGVYSMSLYAISTTLMILGMMLAGISSGFMQSLLGYTGFFIWVLFAYLCIYLIAFYTFIKVPIKD